MERGKNSILRHAYQYMGQDLDKREKFLVLYTGSRLTEDDERRVIMTVQEAAADGWRIIVNGKWRTLNLAVNECFCIDGKLSNMRYDDVSTIWIDDDERGVFLCRGCIFNPVGLRPEKGWRWNRKVGDSLLSVIADACIFVNDVPYDAMKDMLDNGVEVAILRGALRTETGRRAAADGAPVIDSYSSWATDPKAISWLDDEGIPNLLYMKDIC